MSTSENVLIEQIDNVAKITLNRPDAANVMNLALAKELYEAALHCDGNPQIRAVMITGAGKMFSAGGDLKSFSSFGDNISAKLKELTNDLHAAISLFARMDAPVVVAVNGAAAGAGFSLAITGDLVLAAESAKFTMAYTAAGLSPDGSSSYYLPRLIGLRKTQELMLTNRRLSAQEALDWGIISRVVADDQLQSEAYKLASQFANGPTRAFGTTKKLLLETFNNGLETQMTAEGHGIASMTTTRDGKEGISAFIEKRAPEYTGQ
jgi:2-(1,2-epoxy-1,2-dihydrophenyl)acetyl-CoA isomerase